MTALQWSAFASALVGLSLAVTISVIWPTDTDWRPGLHRWLAVIAYTLIAYAIAIELFT